MTNSKPLRWRPPQANRGALAALGRIISDRMYAEALAAVDRLDAIDAEFLNADNAETGSA